MRGKVREAKKILFFYVWALCGAHMYAVHEGPLHYTYSRLRLTFFLSSVLSILINAAHTAFPDCFTLLIVYVVYISVLRSLWLAFHKMINQTQVE